jgi:hypothetical protein
MIAMIVGQRLTNPVYNLRDLRETSLTAVMPSCDGLPAVVAEVELPRATIYSAGRNVNG